VGNKAVIHRIHAVFSELWLIFKQKPAKQSVEYGTELLTCGLLTIMQRINTSDYGGDEYNAVSVEEEMDGSFYSLLYYYSGSIHV
jgi:hypothetical protein